MVVRAEKKGNLDEYYSEVRELERMQIEDGRERKALAQQQKEEEKERKAIAKQKQEERRYGNIRACNNE